MNTDRCSDNYMHKVGKEMGLQVCLDLALESNEWLIKINACQGVPQCNDGIKIKLSVLLMMCKNG